MEWIKLKLREYKKTYYLADHKGSIIIKNLTKQQKEDLENYLKYLVYRIMRFPQ